MTDEERQRQMDFILNSQERSERRLDRLERTLKMLVSIGRRERRDWRERHGALVDAQIKTEDKMQELAEAQRHLAEAQKRFIQSQEHTDRRLDALIDIIREERNGKSQG